MSREWTDIPFLLNLGSVTTSSIEYDGNDAMLILESNLKKIITFTFLSLGTLAFGIQSPWYEEG